MAVSRLSLLIGGISAIWLAMAIYRWWFLYPDISQLILASVIGFMGVGGAYIYNWMKIKEDLDIKRDKRINAIVSWWAKEEKDYIIREAKGEE